MPSVSRRSRVDPTSRIDFTPAQTTVIGVDARVTRSADSSKVSAAPRCTPPSPPVANTRMPARAASSEVDATVVAPVRPSATAAGRSRTDSFNTSGLSAILVIAAKHRPGGRWARRRSPRPSPAGMTPRAAQQGLQLDRDRAVARAGQTMGDQGRLQRHHRPTARQRRPHLRREVRTPPETPPPTPPASPAPPAAFPLVIPFTESSVALSTRHFSPGPSVEPMARVRSSSRRRGCGGIDRRRTPMRTPPGGQRARQRPLESVTRPEPNPSSEATLNARD